MSTTEEDTELSSVSSEESSGGILSNKDLALPSTNVKKEIQKHTKTRKIRRFIFVSGGAKMWIHHAKLEAR